MGERRITPRAWIGVLLSAGLTAWFVWTIDWATLSGSMMQVRPVAVAGASGLLVLEFVLRAVRWKILLRRIVPDARVGDLFSATVIGAAANTLLPARAGELAKPLVASRKVGAPFTSVVATAVMERVYDLLGLVSVLLAMSLVLPSDVGTSSEGAVLVYNLKRYGVLFGAAGLAGMLVFFALARRGEAARGLFGKLAALGPPPIRRRALEIFDGFVAGLASVKDRRALVEAPLISIAIWFNGVAAIYLLFHAFSLDLPFGAACFTAVAIALTVALPQAPGFFGVFHVAIEKTLVLWAIDPSPAKAFAIVFWAVSFVPVTAIGLAALWREGLSLRGIWTTPTEP